MILTERQNKLVSLPFYARVFAEGPAGTGKTTAALNRLYKLLDSGVPGSSILVLLPQRTLGLPYQKALNSERAAPGGLVSLITAAGLAQRMVELYWPLVADQAGFSRPDAPPTFLTLETAQYFMAKLVSPLLEVGFFESVIVERNRLLSQILDNLNKSAVVGFQYTEIGDRLTAAWAGSPGQVRVYEDTQTCATKFRLYCLENNLLDFSLQVEVFWKIVWHLPECRNYLFSNFRHIIADNIEEDTPFAHSILAEWCYQLDSSLLIYDHNAGYRRFLGADPDGAYLLKDFCNTKLTFEQSVVTSPAIDSLSTHIKHIIYREPHPASLEEPRPAIQFHTSRYYTQMLDWVAEQASSLVLNRVVQSSEIVILAPFLSDALRYALVNRLEYSGVPVRTHRPSRSLRDEPITHALITLAKLAHPGWNLKVNKTDIALTLQQIIDGLDLVRSHMLADIVFRTRSAISQLQSFDNIIPDTQERITYLAGERYERLRMWLQTYKSYPPLELDHFLATLFGEVLSQPGFRYHTNYDAGSVTARLIESVQKFRRVAVAILQEYGVLPGEEYIRMVEQGVIAAQYLESWQLQSEDAILIAPAHTFLMGNYPVKVQFWLDIANRSWSERLAQPLTHPYVLSRSWPRDKIWTDADEISTSQDMQYRLVMGLLSRCRQQVYLGLSNLSEQGYEQRGPLLRIINRVIQSYVS